MDICPLTWTQKHPEPRGEGETLTPLSTDLRKEKGQENEQPEFGLEEVIVEMKLELNRKSVSQLIPPE